MYVFPTMINLGLEENQLFPTGAHKHVASRIALRNSNVTNRDTLTEIVQAVLRVPTDRIKEVTLRQLIDEFNCPDVGMSE